MRGSKRTQASRIWIPERLGVEDHIGSAISRSAVDIYDDHPLPPKVLLKTLLNRFYCLADGLRIIVRRDSDEQVYFAYAHKLAKEIVIQECFFYQ